MVTMKSGSATIEGANPGKPDGDGGRVMRPCDIPIYGFPDEQRTTSVDAKESEQEYKVGAVRSGVRTVRLALREAVGPLGEVYETGKVRSASAYQQGPSVRK